MNWYHHKKEKIKLMFMATFLISTKLVKIDIIRDAINELVLAVQAQ